MFRRHPKDVFEIPSTISFGYACCLGRLELHSGCATDQLGRMEKKSNVLIVLFRVYLQCPTWKRMMRGKGLSTSAGRRHRIETDHDSRASSYIGNWNWRRFKSIHRARSILLGLSSHRGVSKFDRRRSIKFSFSVCVV